MRRSAIWSVCAGALVAAACQPKSVVKGSIPVTMRLDERFNTALVSGVRIIIDDVAVPEMAMTRYFQGGVEFFAQGTNIDSDPENEFVVTVNGAHFTQNLFTFVLWPTQPESPPFKLRCDVLGADGLLQSVYVQSFEGGDPIRFPGRPVECAFTCVEGRTCAKPAEPPVVAAIPDHEVAPGTELAIGVAVEAKAGDSFSFRAEMRAGGADDAWVDPLAFGAAFNAATARFTWTPTLAQVAGPMYEVRFTVTNAASLSTSVVAKIRVAVGNARPYLDPPAGYSRIAEGSCLAQVLKPVDPEGDEVSVTLDEWSIPAGETIRVALAEGGWTLSWCPTFAATRTEPYPIGIRLDDGKHAAAPAIETAYVTVTPTVRAPVCDAIGTVTARAGRVKCFDVRTSTPDGVAATLTGDSSAFGLNAVVTFERGASTVDGATARVCVTASEGLSAGGPSGTTVPFVFWADDGRAGGRTRCAVDVTVTPDCESPVFAPVAAQTVVEGAKVTVALAASNSDGSAVSYESNHAAVLGAEQAAEATFNTATGAFVWQTNDETGRAAAYIFEFRAVEATKKCAAAVIQVSVTVGNVDRRQSNGFTCSTDEQCKSGFCVDGVCCASACTGKCVSCKVTGKLGECAPVPRGETRGADCVGGNLACLTGACDGAGACARLLSGSECAASTCGGTNLYRPAATCGDIGGCPTLGQQACANSLICADTANCKTTCAADGDCVTGYCLGGACVGKRLNGAAAERSTQCASGYLVDGTCCSTSSCGTGTCATATGMCATRNGQVCSASLECASGTCAKRPGQATGVCCATGCSGTCMACDVAGSAGTCAPIPSGENNTACSAGAAACLTGACDGAGACARKTPGDVCATATCSGNLIRPAATCGAAGGCPTLGQQACANSLICADTTNCKTTCAADGDCVTGYCLSDTCV
ncbi:MAG: hypothetical protein HYY84_20090, partial [Deltaproteobacteria bacterium]|nr:hypothetical protein [Deltaproteobacteria bacterium]